jgi:hypothetical protein
MFKVNSESLNKLTEEDLNTLGAAYIKTTPMGKELAEQNFFSLAPNKTISVSLKGNHAEFEEKAVITAINTNEGQNSLENRDFQITIGDSIMVLDNGVIKMVPDIKGTKEAILTGKSNLSLYYAESPHDVEKALGVHILNLDRKSKK